MRFLPLLPFALVALVFSGCASNPAIDASDSAALTAHDGFIPYIEASVVAERVAAFRERNGAEWEPAPIGARRRFIASPGSMKSSAVVGPKRTLTRDEARAVAQTFFAKNADLLSVDGSSVTDANLEVYRKSDGMGGSTYLGWSVGLQTPLPAIPIYPDNTSWTSRLWVDIDVDAVVHELTDEPERMPATSLSLDARFAPLDAAMTTTFLGKRVQKTGLACEPSTLQLVEVTRDLGAIEASDLDPVKVLRAFPQDDGALVHIAYDYRLARFGWEYVVDAATADVFRKSEPATFFGPLGGCW